MRLNLIEPVRVLRTVLALGVGLLAAGCIYDETDLTATRPLVQWQDASHRVSFPANAAELSHDQAVALNQFISGIQDGGRVTVLVGRESDRARDQLQQQRAAVIATHLRERGIATRVAAVPGSSYRQSAVVSAARLTVVTPDCPDWERIQQGGTMMGGREQFGCVTASALGSMVADPRDLMRGRTMGSADGTAMSRGVRGYRSGELGAGQRRDSFSTGQGE